MHHLTLLLALLLIACHSSAGVREAPASEAPASEPTAGTEAPVDTPTMVSLSLEEAVENPDRDPKNRARDIYRHPEETLMFFGLEPDMHVLELWPGRGWYTEILAPVLAKDGSLTVALTDPHTKGYRGELARDMVSWFKDNPHRFHHVKSARLSAPDTVDLGAPGSYDLVVTFRNTHNWINDGVAEQVFAAVFEALAPGGVFGVVQHRAPEGADAAKSAKRGYVPQAHLVELAHQAGFELEEVDEVNANPADTKDYAEGVWALPPALRGPENEKVQMRKIGESDRMTLRFRKPAD